MRDTISRLLPIVVLLRLASSAAAQEIDCDRFPLRAVIHTRPIAERPHQTTAILPGRDEVFIARGGSARFWVSIISRLEPVGALPGVQGFSLGFNVTGNVSIDAVTLEGTSSAHAPDGITESPTLSAVYLVEPIKAEPGEEIRGGGVIVAHIYSLVSPVTMTPTGTATVLAVDISAPDGEEPFGAIVFRDGMGGTRGVANTFTVRGESRYAGPDDDRLACMRGAAIVPVDDAAFVRGDADGNGVIELTDGIYIHRYLFVGDPAELVCEDAADLDDSGGLDITDGVIVFMHLFLGGRQPEPPFPMCGADQTRGDRMACETFAGCR